MAYTSIAVGLDPAERVHTTDRPHPEPQYGRIVTISWGTLTIHVGGEGDQGTIDALAPLIHAAEMLRDAARDRIADAAFEAVFVPSDTPLGIEDDAPLTKDPGDHLVLPAEVAS